MKRFFIIMNNCVFPMPRLAKAAPTLLALLLLAAAGIPPTARADDTNQIAPQLQVADRFLLAIPKAGLGKDYLFSASLIPQGGPPTSHGSGGQNRAV